MGMNSHGRSAFTLTELVLTLALITVLASIALPTYFGRPEVTLENAAVLMAKDLRQAQNRAAYLGQAVDFVIERDGSGYSISDPIAADGKHMKRDYSHDAVFEGVRIVNVNLGPSMAFHFSQRGIALGGGSVTLAYAGESRVLRVSSGSGHIQIDGSTSGWVDLDR